jgi:hypothetical protein
MAVPVRQAICRLYSRFERNDGMVADIGIGIGRGWMSAIDYTGHAAAPFNLTIDRRQKPANRSKTLRLAIGIIVHYSLPRRGASFHLRVIIVIYSDLVKVRSAIDISNIA